MFESSSRRQFQRGLDTEKQRASRRDAALSLRRKEREAHLQKKIRTINNKPSFYSANSTANFANTATEDDDLSIEHVPRYVGFVMSDNIEKQLLGVTAIRKLLSMERDPPTKRIKQCGVIPKIIMFMYGASSRCGATSHNKLSGEGQAPQQSSRDKEIWNQLQFEAAWVVTNIAASTSEYTHFVCHHGAIEAFVDLFRSTQNPEIADQAIWGLGNIAGDSRNLRDRILETGFLKDLTTNLQHFDLNLQRNSVWLISNMCRWESSMQVAHINYIAPVLCKFLRESKDVDILRDSLWTFSYLASNPSEPVLTYLVQQTQVISICLKLLHQEVAKYQIALNQLESQSKKQRNAIQAQPQQSANQAQAPQPSITKAAMFKMNDSIYRPCLRFLGSLLSENDDATQAVLDAGYLDVIEPFANHFIPHMRKETMWAFSNILAGTHQQIEAVISRDDLLRSIINAGTCGKAQIQKEACWCIANAVCDSISEQKKKLIDAGALRVLANTLKSGNTLNDVQICTIVEALDVFLALYGDNFNPVADMVEELRILDYLEERQGDDRLHEETFNAIVTLMQKYWPEEGFNPDEVTTQVLKDPLSAAVNAETNTFSFGRVQANNENVQQLANQTGSTQYQF